MKIGILTFSCAYNFGAILQCYALQEHLRLMGQEVYVINYRPYYLESKKPKISRHNVRYLRRFLLHRSSFISYEHFIDKNLKLTNVANSETELFQIISSFDYVIIGSDQIWNTTYNGHDPIWLGRFSSTLNRKPHIIFYAASAGDAVFSASELFSLKKQLLYFDAISVRENKLRQKLENMFPYKNIDVVLDPSLMVDEYIWEKWQKPLINEKYILVYQARQDDCVYRIANDIAIQLNAKVFTVDFYNNNYKFGAKLKVVSPAGFVSLVRNAQCVVTTSFHGTAFSIINKTPFYTLQLNDGADERSYNLLSSIGLNDRFIDKNSTIRFSSVNFDLPNKKLSELRKQSQLFLTKHIV